jgi:hypothetical protein
MPYPQRYAQTLSSLFQPYSVQMPEFLVGSIRTRNITASTPRGIICRNDQIALNNACYACTGLTNGEVGLTGWLWVDQSSLSTPLEDPTRFVLWWRRLGWT